MTRGYNRGELNTGDRVRWRWNNRTGHVVDIFSNGSTHRQITVEWENSDLGTQCHEEKDLFKLSDGVTHRPVLVWQRLEQILRNYYEFRSQYEVGNVGEELELEGGFKINVHDVLQGIDQLPPQQRRVIELVCLNNLTEEEAAIEMGFLSPDKTEGWSSAVGLYKRLGLQRLCEQYWNKY